MSNKEKQIEDDDQADLQKNTEREYRALKKENVQLKQDVEDDCADRKAVNASKLKDKCLKFTNSLASPSSTPRPLPPIARLHDPCLVALFKQLPPADQMTARTVCRRWADLVTYAARSTHSLAILVGARTMAEFKNSINYYSIGSIKVVSLLKKEDGSPMFPLEQFSQWNALLYHEGLEDEATVEAIAATFVNLNALQIGLFDVPSSQFDFISHLLELWRPKLTTLKVHDHLKRPEDPFVGRFFTAINGLTTLKHLRLCLRSLPYHDLPIISRIEQLCVYWDECSPHDFAAMLRQHATASTSLRTVEYLCVDPESAIEHFTWLSDHLLSRFTRFGFPWSQFTNSQVISTHFRHLTSLNIRPTGPIHRLFDHLSQLTQLLYLGLDVHFSSLHPDDQPQLLPQLKSVKALQLRLTIRAHSELEQMKISWTMPNLQAIDCCHFWQSKCTDCTIEEFNPDQVEANPAIFKHCYRQMLAPLKRDCTKLRTMLYNCEKFLGSVDELLAE